MKYLPKYFLSFTTILLCFLYRICINILFFLLLKSINKKSEKFIINQLSQLWVLHIEILMSWAGSCSFHHLVGLLDRLCWLSGWRYFQVLFVLPRTHMLQHLSLHLSSFQLIEFCSLSFLFIVLGFCLSFSHHLECVSNWHNSFPNRFWLQLSFLSTWLFFFQHAPPNFMYYQLLRVILKC